MFYAPFVSCITPSLSLYYYDISGFQWHFQFRVIFPYFIFSYVIFSYFPTNSPGKFRSLHSHYFCNKFLRKIWPRKLSHISFISLTCFKNLLFCSHMFLVTFFANFLVHDFIQRRYNFSMSEKYPDLMESSKLSSS